MKVLLHACCAPCSIECINVLSNEGFPHDLFFYNPNIQPIEEYNRRLSTLEFYAKGIGKNLIVQPTEIDYNAVRDTYAVQCQGCYDIRMDMVAKKCSQLGYSHFCTTLLISPYQNHELLKNVCLAVANKYGVKFLYQDFRPNFRKGQQLAKELGLYRQKYCGCLTPIS